MTWEKWGRRATVKWIDESGIVTATSPCHQLILVERKILSFSFLMILFYGQKKPHANSE